MNPKDIQAILNQYFEESGLLTGSFTDVINAIAPVLSSSSHSVQTTGDSGNTIQPETESVEYYCIKPQWQYIRECALRHDVWDALDVPDGKGGINTYRVEIYHNHSLDEFMVCYELLKPAKKMPTEYRVPNVPAEYGVPTVYRNDILLPVIVKQLMRAVFYADKNTN